MFVLKVSIIGEHIIGIFWVIYKLTIFIRFEQFDQSFGNLICNLVQVQFYARPRWKFINILITIIRIVFWVNLCIFNKLFGDRVVNYKTSQQELNDLYVLSAKNFFGDSIKNKYEELDKFLVDAIMEITGDDIHQLTEEEKESLQKTFYTIAWKLNNWGNYEFIISNKHSL